MCFRFDSWCCFGAMPRHEDFPPPAERNDGLYHHYGRHTNGGLGHSRAPHQQEQQQLPVVAGDEGDRKASSDARRGHNAPAAGAQEKAYYVYSGADGALGGKQQHPATKAKIVDGAPYFDYHYERREPARGHGQEYYQYYR